MKNQIRYDSPWEAYEQTGSSKAYYEQFLGATLEVGKVYTQAKGTWHEKDYKIVFIVDGVALGTCVSNDKYEKGRKELFYASGIKKGWKYQDDRPVYRLQEKEV